MKFPITVLSMSAVLLGACAQTAPNWDSTFGDAARQAVASQVLDPAAPGRKAGTMMVDGKAASGAMKAYADSFGYAVKEAKQQEIAITTNQGGR